MEPRFVNNDCVEDEAMRQILFLFAILESFKKYCGRIVLTLTPFLFLIACILCYTALINAFMCLLSINSEIVFAVLFFLGYRTIT